MMNGKICSGLFVLFVLILSSYPVYSQITWSDPIEIAEGTSPDMVIDRNTGNLHIVTKRYGITYTVMDSTGTIIHQEIVPGTENDNKSWDAGATIAVDPDGNPHLCYRWQYESWIYRIYYKRKVGKDWLGAVQIADNKIRGYNVRMAVDQDFRVHIVCGERGDEIWGPVTYYRIKNGFIDHVQENIEPTAYRSDSALEIDTDSQNHVHVVFGCPGQRDNTSAGLITYYRGIPEQDDLFYVTRLQSDFGQGRTASPDIFADQAGYLHFSYGSNQDVDAGDIPAIRYVRYMGNSIIRNTLVTRPGDLDPWLQKISWGVSSVSSSDNGQAIVVAYTSNAEGSGVLRASMSADSGQTWLPPVNLAGSCGGEEQRNNPVIRANRNHFYLVYPDNSDNHIKLRYLWDGGDGPPRAVIAAEYTGNEGQTIQFDASASQDMGLSPNIVDYAWDWDLDGVIDDVTSNPIMTHTYADDFHGQLSLTVRDGWDQTHSDTAEVHIQNVAPTVTLGPDLTIEEGDTLQLDSQLQEPGADLTQVRFKVENGPWQSGNTLTQFFPDDGVFLVVCRAEDDDGGVGSDTVSVTVDNIAPTVSMDIPAAGSTNMVLQFRGVASDPGVNDVLTYEWDCDNDGVWEKRGRTISATFVAEGTYPIHLRVSDNDGGFGFDTRDLRIQDVPPDIAFIPNQVFDEGSILPALSLDDFVFDPVVGDDQLDWSVSGSNALQVMLQNRMLQVAVPDSEWSGEERLTVICSNHISLKDTGEVLYRILPVNDRPKWTTPVPEFSVPEDDSLLLLYSDLLPLVEDVDNDPEDLIFEISDHVFVSTRFDEKNQGLFIIPLENWAGQTELTVSVKDPDGTSDEDTFLLTVDASPDQPYSFSLIDPMYYRADTWPDTLWFHWRQSFDPDVPGSITYEWSMEHQGGLPTSPKVKHHVVDSTFGFAPQQSLMEGTYFWWVTANSGSGGARRSENMGFVVIGTPTDVEKQPETETVLPTEFALLQNYPNPFNPQTRIDYQLPSECDVCLSIYNPLGRLVRRLVSGTQAQGVYSVIWNARDDSDLQVRTGIYIYRLQAGDRVFERKMLLVQ